MFINNYMGLAPFENSLYCLVLRPNSEEQRVQIQLDRRTSIEKLGQTDFAEARDILYSLLELGLYGFPVFTSKDELSICLALPLRTYDQFIKKSDWKQPEFFKAFSSTVYIKSFSVCQTPLALGLQTIKSREIPTISAVLDTNYTSVGLINLNDKIATYDTVNPIQKREIREIAVTSRILAGKRARPKAVMLASEDTIRRFGDREINYQFQTELRTSVNLITDPFELARGAAKYAETEAKG